MIFVVRFGVFAAVVLTASSARAGWLETSGFVGVDSLPSDVKLGGNTADAEQRPQTGPELGARVGWIAVPLDHVELGVEAEVGFTASWTGYGFDTMRSSNFAPVIAYRGSLLLRFADLAQIKPHVLVGAGGASVISRSPYLQDSSDPQLFYGVGATIELGHEVQLRIDGRQGWLPTLHGEGATFELLLGVGTSYGRPSVRRQPIEEQVPAVAAVPPPPPPPPVDPTPVVVAPPPPPPDPNADSDGDGIADAHDACPHDPETVNGFEDEDGCPDVVPPSIATALGNASTARFEAHRVRITDAAAAAFAPALDLMHTNPHLKLDIVSHAAPDDPNGELAKKRADAVRWHFVEQGVPEDRLTIVAGKPAADPAIELVLHSAPKPKQ
jgi:OOP family OmpA-OmpF porin